MNIRSFNDLFSDIRQNLHRFQCVDYDLVVGVPRSGVIPAFYVALMLNLPCVDLMSLVFNTPLRCGETRPSKMKIKYPWEAKRILLIDDSVYSGKSMANALASIPKECNAIVDPFAVYGMKDRFQNICKFCIDLSTPRHFEWNIFHQHSLRNACVDIDGVLCLDPTEEENDDGQLYTKFILEAKPLVIPSAYIHALVTNRLDKYRSETERWLEFHGVKYGNLIMLHLPSKEARLRLKVHAKHKAQYYRNSKTSLFIESSDLQAREIAELSGKPVYSYESSSLFRPGLTGQISYGKLYMLKRFKAKLSRLRRLIALKMTSRE